MKQVHFFFFFYILGYKDKKCLEKLRHILLKEKLQRDKQVCCLQMSLQNSFHTTSFSSNRAFLGSDNEKKNNGFWSIFALKKKNKL